MMALKRGNTVRAGSIFWRALGNISDIGPLMLIYKRKNKNRLKASKLLRAFCSL